jgi:indolepyruvate decarboxylase
VVLGQGRGFIVDTEGQLDEALRESERRSDTFCILDVRLAQHDCSPALRRFSARMAKQL